MKKTIEFELSMEMIRSSCISDSSLLSNKYECSNEDSKHVDEEER